MSKSDNRGNTPNANQVRKLRNQLGNLQLELEKINAHLILSVESHNELLKASKLTAKDAKDLIGEIRQIL